MKKLIQKSAVVAGTVAMLSVPAVMSTAPAHAGGPGTTYAKGSAKAQCDARLFAYITVAKARGGKVTGVHECYRVAPGSGSNAWLGNFVVNY